MKARLRFKGKEILIEDLIKAERMKKFTGLMFKGKDAQAMLFEFPKGKRTIHSYFCKPFLAIWLNNGKIVEHRLVSPNKPAIIPESEFNQLIEIPMNEKYKEILGFFIDASEIL